MKINMSTILIILVITLYLWWMFRSASKARKYGY